MHTRHLPSINHAPPHPTPTFPSLTAQQPLLLLAHSSIPTSATIVLRREGPEALPQLIAALADVHMDGARHRCSRPACLSVHVVVVGLWRARVRF